ncbi:hypothetical protein P9E76_04920 [Schinkia azotoformans]|uniref:Uncharacterized protein n=1 Tax=Schinkia azotoformans LMG 9581 TaxID=1131731 RepID=K6C8C6_SCHAZ|nr:hypothetical protein [Schinkia azotoformans]EKN67395.1 hypothetical protein BAZO_09541 [Schinkia azotoformans LMG 9581]MEC1639352.1 hypothetical protein [Schinkia azotoformans]MEC1944394.1 hypothetical protein [Schinkia azotoformans]
MTKKSCDEMIQYMKDMDNGERIKFLNWLSYEHFGRKPISKEEIARLNYEAMYGDEERYRALYPEDFED